MSVKETEFGNSLQILASDGRSHFQSKGRRERQAVETRLRLFRCALQLIAERGLPNVTVEDITEAAAVGKGTFFNYFESKDQVLGVMAEIHLGKVRKALELARVNRRSIQSVVRHFFERIAEELGRSPELARAFMSSFLAGKGVRELMDRNMSEGQRMAAQIVAIGQKRGDIDQRLKKEEVVLLLHQVFTGASCSGPCAACRSCRSRFEGAFSISGGR
jgi:AcrR family transcriptional regulator